VILTRRSLLSLAASAAAPVGAFAAPEWPSRAIRMLVGTAPGGSPDIIARILAEKLVDRLGVAVVVENMMQSAGAVAYELVSRSAPDGYLMAVLTAGFAPQALLHRQRLSYDPVKGFAFVTMLCGYPMVYAVAPGSPITSFRDLLARAKAEPGRITYTITAQGSIYHMLTKWIEIEAGVTMTPITYRGTAQGVTDVLAGRVDLMVDTATTGFPRVQSGQLRLLAISSPGRYALMPEAPLVRDVLPGVECMSWLGLAMAPATPRPIVEHLNRAVRVSLAMPDVAKRLAEGGNVVTPSTPDEMRQKVEGELARWAHVIETAGIRTE
jgi:tripartite-type tricarboxylate transporter receptor subunit TctC